MCFKQRLCICALDFRLTERLGASERSQGTEMQRGIVKTRVSQASSLFASYRSLELGVPLHEPLILMHSVRGNGRGADVGFRKGRIDTSGNMRLSKPMSRLTTQERVGNAPAKGFGRKMSSGSRFEKASLGRDVVLGLRLRREIDVGGQWQPRV